MSSGMSFHVSSAGRSDVPSMDTSWAPEVDAEGAVLSDFSLLLAGGFGGGAEDMVVVWSNREGCYKFARAVLGNPARTRRRDSDPDHAFVSLSQLIVTQGVGARPRHTL